MPMTTWPYHLEADANPPSHPDRFLAWIARRQWRTLLLGAFWGSVWMLPIALMPAILGRAIDDGIVARDLPALLTWAGVIAAMGLLSALSTTMRHTTAIGNRLFAAFRAAISADRAVRRAGPALTRERPVGEVLTAFTTDVWKLGQAFDVFARFSGSVVGFVVVAVILVRSSPLLGLLVLVGAPLLTLSLGLLMRPLHHRKNEQREQAGRLTTLGADTVAGLRVLRGVGGEATFMARYAAQSARVRAAGVRLAGVQAALEAAQVVLPGLFVVLVTLQGSRLALAGEISAGQLIAFYGYTAFLVMPIRTATEFVDVVISTRVAAGKLSPLLEGKSDYEVHDQEGSERLRLGALIDPTSGVRIEPTAMTALVSARPEDTAAIAARLARSGPGRHNVTYAGVALDDSPIEAVRSSIVVSESDPVIFSGSLRSSVGGTAEGIDEALRVADAADVLDSIDGGIDGNVEERGRALSGGQRQRLVLARALTRDPDVLILVEPTSAVDAHTEARIAKRLAAHRAGRTTVIVTASPLMLDQADTVLFIEDARVVAHGTHRTLVRDNAAYGHVVGRGGED